MHLVLMPDMAGVSAQDALPRFRCSLVSLRGNLVGKELLHSIQMLGVQSFAGAPCDFDGLKNPILVRIDQRQKARI